MSASSHYLHATTQADKVCSGDLTVHIDKMQQLV